MIELILGALWYIWPAYIANAFPPVIKGQKPVDFNKTFRNKPILGNNKTIEGSIVGIVFGIAVGLFQLYAVQGLVLPYIEVPVLTLNTIILLSVGAIIGDFIGSFIKRQTDVSSGKSLPFIDQLDFLFGALIFTGFALKIHYIIVLIAITLLLHIIASIFAYYLKLKQDRI